MDRREWHERLESSHARGEAEDAYNKRKKDCREIEEGMDKIVRPIYKRKEK